MQRKVARPVQNVDAALRAYYGNGYINNKAIKEIFGFKSDTAVWKMKMAVRDEEVKRNIPIVIPQHVNVKIAFEVWGIDIKELERNRQKLLDLNLA